jgi:hypothetical protein
MNTHYNSMPPSVAGSETSRAAAESMVPCVAKIREMVRLQIVIMSQFQGATCDEIEVHLALSHQTASARIRELYLGGHIDYRRNADGTLVKRKTRSGRNAQVYVVRGYGKEVGR